MQTFNDKDELWLPVVGWEGLYEVSDWGRVRSVAGRITQANLGGQWRRYGKLLAPETHRQGYLRVRLMRLGREAHVLIHRLVCEAFHGVPETYLEVNHKNFIKNDNRPCNLEWVSPLENRAHMVTHKMHAHGAKSGQAKFTNEQIREVRRLRKQGQTTVALGKKYKVNSATISRICTRNCWKHVA